MGTRRSPSKVLDQRAWKTFLSENDGVVRTSGLPAQVLAAEGSWLEFLEHGFVSNDPLGFDVDKLSQAQYASLVRLTERYFAAGNPWFIPIALHAGDRQVLRERFDAAS